MQILKNYYVDVKVSVGYTESCIEVLLQLNILKFWWWWWFLLKEAKEMRRSKSTTPGVSPVQSEASDSNSQFTGHNFFRQDPDFIVIKQESSDSLDTSQNLSANRSFYSIASSGSTSIRSLSESFKEVDEDSQFSYTSSTRTDSWLTEQELKPNGIINLFLFIINSSEVFILSQTW